MKRLALLALLALAACTQPEDARRILSSAGYSDVQITGYGWFDCGKDDTFATQFSAKGPTGVPVRGTVCSGLLLKNSTIRIR